MNPFIVRIAEVDNVIDWELDKGAVELMYRRFFATSQGTSEHYPLYVKAYVEKHGRRVFTPVDDKGVHPVYFLQESMKGASYLLLQAKEWLDKWKKEADAALEATLETPPAETHSGNKVLKKLLPEQMLQYLERLADNENEGDETFRPKDGIIIHYLDVEGAEEVVQIDTYQGECEEEDDDSIMIITECGIEHQNEWEQDSPVSIDQFRVYKEVALDG